MKNLVWIIIAAVIAIGGYMLYSGRSVQEIATEAADAVNAPEALESATAAVGEAVDATEGAVADAVDATAEAAEAAADAVTEAASDAATAVADTATAATEAAAEAASDAATAVSETASEATDAAAEAATGTDPTGDLNASIEYRQHLARILTKRALAEAPA